MFVDFEKSYNRVPREDNMALHEGIWSGIEVCESGRGHVLG